MAALASSIALFYLAMMINGFGGGMFRPANASSLSLAQTPDNQGKAAGYLGSVMPIGHVLTSNCCNAYLPIRTREFIFFQCIPVLYFLIIYNRTPIIKRS